MTLDRELVVPSRRGLQARFDVLSEKRGRDIAESRGIARAVLLAKWIATARDDSDVRLGLATRFVEWHSADAAENLPALAAGVQAIAHYVGLRAMRGDTHAEA